MKAMTRKWTKGMAVVFIFFICISKLMIGNVNAGTLQSYDSYQQAVYSSPRVNFLCIGIEGGVRADTMILASYDPESKKMDIISVPRDTYYYKPGYERADQRKINAAYGRDTERGSMQAVADVVGIPVHHYITADFEGLKHIVDLIGGIEVDVSMDMYDMPKGKQLLDGEHALKFVRFRKGYADGDLGRVRAQQQFIQAAIPKIYDINNLSKVLKAGREYVKTNVPLKEALLYAVQLKDIEVEDIEMHILPGYFTRKPIGAYNLWYYIHNSYETKEMIKKIYGITGEKEEQVQPDVNISRAEFAALIVRVLGLEETEAEVQFQDIKEMDPHGKEVKLAAEHGIIVGSEGKFYPGKYITREEMAVMLDRAVSEKRAPNASIQFADQEKISRWAIDSIRRVTDLGLMAGYEQADGKYIYEPKNNVTREEAIHILNNLIQFEHIVDVE